MTDIVTLNAIRTLLISIMSGGGSATVRQKAQELLGLFETLDYSDWLTDFNAANPSQQVDLLDLLQSAIIASNIIP